MTDGVPSQILLSCREYRPEQLATERTVLSGSDVQTFFAIQNLSHTNTPFVKPTSVPTPETTCHSLPGGLCSPGLILPRELLPT